MSPVDRDLLYVQHIEDRIARIEGIATQGRDAFNASYILQDAVIRSFEVIGEAVKNLSADRTARYPDIPWRRVAGFRDILIHKSCPKFAQNMPKICPKYVRNRAFLCVLEHAHICQKRRFWHQKAYFEGLGKGWAGNS